MKKGKDKDTAFEVNQTSGMGARKSDLDQYGWDLGFGVSGAFGWEVCVVIFGMTHCFCVYHVYVCICMDERLGPLCSIMRVEGYIT